MEERSKLLHKRKLFYGCFEEVNKDPDAKSCVNQSICKACNGKHPATLHGYLRKKMPNDSQKNGSIDTPNGFDVKCATLSTGGIMIRMCVVPVSLTYSRYGRIVKENCQSCSQGTFMLEKLLRDVGVNRQKTSITIKTVNGEFNNKTILVKGLTISNSRDEDGEWIELPNTFVTR